LPDAEKSPDKTTPAGFLSFTLHAHLPYVVNHGTWPHGLEWLLEAAAETYLPLLRVLERLERDGIALRLNLNLSPILLEQLAHPVFQAEFPQYVRRKIVAAREDEAFFTHSGEPHYAETARFWNRYFTDALDQFQALDGNIIGALAAFEDRGQIEIITCAATHGYLPLLGTDESVSAQVTLAVETHEKHVGRRPRGIWSPECGYRWSFPVDAADGTVLPAKWRMGVEQFFSQRGLSFFFVDTHLVEESTPVASPYDIRIGHSPRPRPTVTGEPHSVYRPYIVESSGATSAGPKVGIYPRDPRTGLQVWSGETGYPGDGNYLDFHKKRWPGGHRYWRVTGPHVEMGDKQAYFPHDAMARTQEHASHFAHIVNTALAEARAADPAGSPPILTAPFDAELFGHWWFEGPLWLEAVARVMHAYPTGIELISASDYLDRFPPREALALHEGSWGAEGGNDVWLNPETRWTWTHIYPAEVFIGQVANEGLWRTSDLGRAIVQQMCRELLLLESSDWQFLITTGAARDYAELRFGTHKDQFAELKELWYSFVQTRDLNDYQRSRLSAIEQRDSIFKEIDPALWMTPAGNAPS
jgi:1,4-alpha-glucan branching enzyme